MMIIVSLYINVFTFFFFLKALLDAVKVNIEHSNFPLRDLAQITVRDPQTLMVMVHDTDVSVIFHCI